MVADAEEIKREVEDLWTFHDRRLRAGTPVARLRDRVAFSQDPPWRLVACRECGLLYRNPAERAFEVQSIYERIWRGRECAACKLKETCPGPLDAVDASP